MNPLITHLSTQSWASIRGPWRDPFSLPELPTTAQRLHWDGSHMLPLRAGRTAKSSWIMAWSWLLSGGPCRVWGSTGRDR